jgi:hypothetical protein
MDSKYCSACIKKLPLSSFLKDASADLRSRVFKTCILCRDKSKRKASQLSGPDLPSKRRTTRLTEAPTPSILPLESRPSVVLDSKYCSSCVKKLPLSSFLADASADLGSKVFKTCITCRRSKREAAQPFRPDVPPNRPATRPAQPPESRPSIPHPRSYPSIVPPDPPGSRPGSPCGAVPTPPPPIEPRAASFLPAEQWGYIQSFHTAMDKVEMETCRRCKARWFAMDLKHGICHACFLRDKGNRTPFLMSAENEMTRESFRPICQS